MPKNPHQDNAKAKPKAKDRKPVEKHDAPNDKWATTFVILAAFGAVAIALLTHYGLETPLVWASFLTGVFLIVAIHFHWRSPGVQTLCTGLGAVLFIGCLVWQYRLSFPKHEARSALSMPTPNPEAPAKADASPTPVAVQEERILLDVKPEYLVGFFKKYTTAQAQKLVETYIGKWVKISGTVKDVDRSVTLSDKPGDPTVDLSTKSSEGSFRTAAYFKEQRWQDRALVLKPGDKITVFGRITRITWWGLTLEKCEFVE
jgi:hypothetical protein